MEDESFGFAEEEMHEIIKRYERMRNNNENHFFDVSEFETIIDYYLDLNDVNYAYEAALAAYEQHPGAASIQIRKAKVLIDKGRPVDALRITRVMEKLEPNNYEIFLLKGSALGMLGDLKGTKKYFDIALKLDESEYINILLSITSILNNLNHYSLLAEYLEELVQLEPEYNTHLYDLAFTYEKTGAHDESIRYYKLYLEEEPFSDNAWYNLGVLYGKKNKHGEAIEAYEYAIAINPENFFAIFNMANILSSEGEYAKALEAYLQYLDFEDESSEAMTYAAECYERLGYQEKAIDMYNEAINLDPGFSAPWYGMGMLMLDIKPSESVRYLRKAVALKDDDPDYWYFLSEAYYNTNSLKESFRSLMKAVSINPYYDSAWLRMGKLIIARRYYMHADTLLEKGIKIVGDVYGIRYVLASTYLHKGNKARFLSHFEKAMNDSPDRYRFFRSLFPDQMMDEKTRIIIKQNKRR